MKRSSYVILLTLLAGMLVMSSCGVKRSQAYYDQATQVLSANYDGSYVLRVPVRARNAAVGFADAKRQAVHDVIFKGAQAASNGISDLKPLVCSTKMRRRNTRIILTLSSRTTVLGRNIALYKTAAPTPLLSSAPIRRWCRP